MSSSYTPTPEFTDSTTVLADGDAANATNLNAAPKKALDRAAYLRAATDGLLVWPQKARVATGGTNNGNFAVYVSAIEAVSLLSGTTWGAYSSSSETQLTSASHFGSGTLTADTMYYVYATLSGGVLTYEVSVTAPDAPLTWKTGAVGTHRYLFCFHSDSTGVPLPMQMSSRHYLYRVSAVASTELRALSTTAEATSVTDVILARAGTAGKELIPAHSRVAFCRSTLNVTGNHADDLVVASYVTKGDTAGVSARHDAPAVSSGLVTEHDFRVETDTSRTIQYTLNFSNTDAGDPTATLTLLVLGFEE